MVYIQSDSDRKLPHHFDCASALYGAIESVLDYRLTSFEEVQSGKFDNLIRANLFVGSVEFMCEVFTRVNKVPQPIMNSNREHDTLPLREVRLQIANGKKLFVKPFQQKLFSGLVVDQYSISSLKEFDDNLDVMVYDVLPKIVSEWRMYVLYNKIEDARNYGGDFKISPDYKFAESIIQQYKSKLPDAYTMDVGVYNEQSSVAISNFGVLEMNYKSTVIEFNDMYAIGNYGMDNSTYLRMLRERYFQIMRS